MCDDRGEVLMLLKSVACGDDDNKSRPAAISVTARWW